jgi:hypothetical protein
MILDLLNSAILAQFQRDLERQIMKKVTISTDINVSKSLIDVIEIQEMNNIITNITRDYYGN